MPNEEQNQKNPSKSYCGKCGMERSPINMCRCLGGGSGDESNKDNKTKSKDNLNPLDQITKSSEQVLGISTPMLNKPAWMQSQKSSDKMINYEAGWSLFFKSDRLNGTLIFRVKPGLPNDEIKKALQERLKAIKIEFDDFKNQLTKQGISTENFTAVLKDNELTIHIPTTPNPKYYDAFIKYLENKNLLPSQNQEHEEKKEITQSPEEDEQPTFNPSPFSTRLEW